MPRDFMFTKEEILTAALDLVREKGFEGVTARAMGVKLGTSHRPVFSYFDNMESLKSGIIEKANDVYQNYLKQDMSSGKYPLYKASGMAYIRFAREEKELFKLLFMRDRTNEDKTKNGEEVEMLAELLSKQLSITKENAMLFHLEMWTYVHGIGTMLATNYYDWSEDLASRTLTDMFEGLKHKYENKN